MTWVAASPVKVSMSVSKFRVWVRADLAIVINYLDVKEGVLSVVCLSKRSSR